MRVPRIQFFLLLILMSCAAARLHGEGAYLPYAWRSVPHMEERVEKTRGELRILAMCELAERMRYNSTRAAHDIVSELIPLVDTIEDPEIRLTVRMVEAMLKGVQPEERKDAIRTLEEIHEQAQALQDAYLTGRVLIYLSDLQRDEGQFVNAESNLLLSRTIFAEMRDLDWQFVTLTRLSLVYGRTDQWNLATDVALDTLAMAEDLGNSWHFSIAHSLLAQAYIATDQLDRAMESLERVSAYNRESGDLEGLVRFLKIRGELAREREDLNTAEQFFSNALDVAQSNGYPFWEPGLYSRLACTRMELGRTKDALDLQESVHRILESRWMSTYIAGYDVAFASSAARAREYEIARRFYRSAQERFNPERDMAMLQWVYLGLSDLARYEGDFRMALQYYELHKSFSDRFRDQRQADQVERSRQAFENRARELEISSLRRQAELQENRIAAQARVRNLSVLGLILSIVILLLLFLRYHSQKEMNQTLRRTIQQVRRAEAEAARASAAKSDFLANMSHEIRTPLNGLIGMTTLMQETSLDADQQQFLQTIYSCARNLLTTINNILDLSKMDASRMHLETIPFSPRDVVENLCANARQEAERKGLSFRCEVSQHLPDRIEGDPTRLTQVVGNLLGNAIKFTESGEVGFAVSVQFLTRDYCELRIDVTDTGIGIPADRQAAIFESFEQADTSVTRVYGGTGLGLTISKRLCEVMGGSIAVESELGTGTTFTVRLPFPVVLRERAGVEQALSDTALEETDEGTGDRLLPRSAAFRVLLFEENRLNRRVLSLMLSEWRVESDRVVSVEDALQMLNEMKFDCMIVATEMLRKDGDSLIRKLRSEVPVHRQPYIVALFSTFVGSELERAKEAGIDNYLVKPVRAEALRQVLLQAYRSRRRVAKQK